MSQTLTSLQNPTVKNLVALRQRRERERQQLILLDGARAIRLALYNTFPLITLYYAVDRAASHAELLQYAHAAGITLQAVTPAVFHKIGYGDHPDGLLGLATPPCVDLTALPTPPCPLYLVAEGLEKPGNLGAILRSADAAGITGLIVCDGQTDIWNPNVIRASQGAFCTVPLVVASASAVLTWLRQQRAQILVALPKAQKCYTTADLRRPTALVVGAEHVGLSPVWRRETAIGIPMAGQVDSLNVAQAASILLFEAVRQRFPLDSKM
jgi:TrmH family RNA methyltransferase